MGVDNSDGQFWAHAWPTFDDRVLIGGSSIETYRQIAALSTHGVVGMRGTKS